MCDSRCGLRRDDGTLYTGSIRWLTNDEQLLSTGHASLDSETETVDLPAQLLWAAADEGARSEPPACELVPEPEEWQGPVTLACRGEREKVMLALRRFRYLEDQDELAVLSGGLCSDQLGNVLQVMCLSADELALYGVQGCAVNIGETVPISREHETRVGMALAAACRHALARCVCVCVCVCAFNTLGLLLESRGGRERIFAEIDKKEPGSATKRSRLLVHAIMGCLACEEVRVELWHIVS